MDNTMTTQHHAYDSTRTLNTGMVTKESQERRILAYLKSGKTLTPLDALDRFGCLRLGARAFDLRKKGHPIKTTMIKTYSGKRIARYSYEQADS